MNAELGRFVSRFEDRLHPRTRKVIGVRADNRTFTAPIGGEGATAPVHQPNEEEAT
jgi:hypothetical protein